MIIQCAQCTSKFRLDDSKVTESGIKVRCSKCKHIFVVKKEQPAEEPDLDLILQGLETTPSAEKAEQEPAVAAVSPPVAGAESPTAAEEPGVGDWFGEEPGAREELPVSEPFAGEAPSTLSPSTSAEEEEGRFDTFEFDSELSRPGEAPSAEPAPESEDFDFGSLAAAPSDEEAPGEEAGKVAEAPLSEGDFEDEIIFGEVDAEAFAAATGASESALKAGESAEVGFVFEEEETVPVEGAPAPEKEEVEEPFDFGEIDFGIEEAVAAREKEEPEVPVPTATASSAATEEFREGPVPSVAVPFGDEELPPLTISSRRKGQSFLPIVVIAVSVIVIVALAGAGFYFFKEGPEGFKKLGVGFLAEWLGMEVREEGAIGLDKVKGGYLKNAEAGEIFVIRGEAVNNFKKPRASIQVKGALVGPNGQPLVQKTAYCGNSLSDEQLATLPMAKIDAAMNNQFGDSLSNLGVQPGKRIPFVIVLATVPKEAKEYLAEVVGSTVASQ